MVNKKNYNPNRKWWVSEEDFPRSPYAEWDVRISEFYDSKEELEELIKGCMLESKNGPHGGFRITNGPCCNLKSKTIKLYKKIYLDI